jgi:hypothetical protein
LMKTLDILGLEMVPDGRGVFRSRHSMLAHSTASRPRLRRCNIQSRTTTTAKK